RPRAGVLIVTGRPGNQVRRDASPRRTVVSTRARIAIVARDVAEGQVAATRLSTRTALRVSVAGVRGAGIAVVAAHRLEAADPPRGVAGVDGTGVQVIAGGAGKLRSEVSRWACLGGERGKDQQSEQNENG